jgi:RNA polymerase sigma factor (sigma-70 family)
LTHETGERLDDLEALARRYEHRVHFFARRVEQKFMLGSRWTDDLVSAGYWGLCKALKNRHPEAEERELSAYVSVRIRGAVLDEARICIHRTACHEVVTSPDHFDYGDAAAFAEWRTQPLTSACTTPEHAVSLRRRWSHVAQALELLEADQQRLIGAYMDGASIPEIARAEGVAVATMRSRFQKISRTLRGQAPHLRRLLLDC